MSKTTKKSSTKIAKKYVVQILMCLRCRKEYRLVSTSWQSIITT